MATDSLSSAQIRALFDILTHHQSYEEVANLKFPNTIVNFGPPLQESSPESPSSPLIQIMLRRFVLILPGVREISATFWNQHVGPLFKALTASDLSESYDKGSIGTRKTLATACAAMYEYCARGSLGGCPKREIDRSRTYDSNSPDEVESALDDFLQEIVYGDLLERLSEKIAITDQLSDHEPLVQAAHSYISAIYGLDSSFCCSWN